MMKISKDHFEKIDALFDLDHWYIVSPFLKIYPYDSDFDHLHAYYEANYLKDYSKRVERILFPMICYDEAIVYLTEFYEGNPLKRFEQYAYRDFRGDGLRPRHH